MNVPQLAKSPPSPTEHRRTAVVPPAASSRRCLHRARDFGVGYGNSSGYASARRYTDGHIDPLFRCR